MRITRVVSGGQTGADRGGLDAAIQAGIPHGGWCPKGRKAEDGAIPVVYKLKETPSANYLQRTEWNVRDSDTTVIFTHGPLEGGSKKTAEFALKHGRSFLHVNLKEFSPLLHPADQADTEIVNGVVEWLSGLLPRPEVLNVAGQRESKSPGIQAEVRVIVAEVLKRCTTG
jgi:hypothetical protein